MIYKVLKREIHNGVPPTWFLDLLVGWGKTADDSIFAPRENYNIYDHIQSTLGPYSNLIYRRGVMLDVLTVLAGFESSWNPDEGADITNPKENSELTRSAGMFQISADSLAFGDDLKDLTLREVGSLESHAFRVAMKQNKLFAVEYTARLLRHTVKHNGPVRDHHIDKWLSREAAEEFVTFIS